MLNAISITVIYLISITVSYKFPVSLLVVKYYLNEGFSAVIIPTSISEDLKSADSTVDKHVMATCKK